ILQVDQGTAFRAAHVQVISGITAPLVREADGAVVRRAAIDAAEAAGGLVDPLHAVRAAGAARGSRIEALYLVRHWTHQAGAVVAFDTDVAQVRRAAVCLIDPLVAPGRAGLQHRARAVVVGQILAAQ